MPPIANRKSQIVHRKSYIVHRPSSHIVNRKSSIVHRTLSPFVNRKSYIVNVLLLLIAAPASAQMSITSVSPDSAWSVEPPLSGDFTPTLTGSFPIPGVTVTLSKAGQPDIVAANVTWVSPTEIGVGTWDSTAQGYLDGFNLVGAAPGTWDLEVSHLAFGSATLAGAVTVKPPTRSGGSAPGAGRCRPWRWWATWATWATWPAARGW